MGGFVYSNKNREDELIKALRQWQCFMCTGDNTFLRIITKDSDSVTFSGEGTKKHPLTAVATGSAGDVTDGENLSGSGIGVFTSKVSGKLQYRKLAGTASQIGVALSGNDIVFTNLAPNIPETMSSVGAGTAIFTAKSGANFPMKSFVDGINTEVVDNGTTIQINASGGGGGSNSLLGDL